MSRSTKRAESRWAHSWAAKASGLSPADVGDRRVGADGGLRQREAVRGAVWVASPAELGDDSAGFGERLRAQIVPVGVPLVDGADEDIGLAAVTLPLAPLVRWVTGRQEDASSRAQGSNERDRVVPDELGLV